MNLSNFQQQYKNNDDFNVNEENIPVIVISKNINKSRDKNLLKNVFIVATSGIITGIIILIIYYIIRKFDAKKKLPIEEKRVLFSDNGKVMLLEENGSTLKASDILEIDKENKEKMLVKQDFKNAPFILLFYAGWCPHCKSSAPDFEKAAEKNTSGVLFIAVEETKIPVDFPIKGYPTIYLWDGHRLGEYNDKFSVENFITAANEIYEEYQSYIVKEGLDKNKI